MSTLLLLCQIVSAQAGRAVASLADDVDRDGVRGVELTLDGDEARVLARRDARLDPARHRVYPRLVDPAGRVLHDGRQAVTTTGPGRGTTTAPLPADDAVHLFFVPYHRIGLPPGEHRATVQLMLDAGLQTGPVEVLAAPVTLDMPELDWVFTAVEHPVDPGRAGDIAWRVALGQDVVATRGRLPAVVVLAEGDELELQVQDPRSERFVRMSRRTLTRAAIAARQDPRAVRYRNVRKRPPTVVRPEARTEPSDGLLALSWTLEGSAVDALVPLRTRPYLVGEDGTPLPLPTRAVRSSPTQALHEVPTWALPADLQPGGTWRVGFEVVAEAGEGSPLTRELVLGRSEHEVRGPDRFTDASLTARVVGANVVDDDGLGVVLDLAWDLPEGMPATGLAELTVGWSGFDARLSGPWTPCAEDGAPVSCAEAWGSGPLTDAHGLTRVRLPLAWKATGAPDSPWRVDARVGLPGRRTLGASLAVEGLEDRVMHDVEVRPRKVQLACRDGEPVRWVWLAGRQTLAESASRPCEGGQARWSGDDRFHLQALDGDTLELGIAIGERVLRKRRIRIAEGRVRPELADDTAGVDRARISLRIRPRD